MPRLFALLLCLLLPAVAGAQDRANTILVLDGSGSMWGQIDGVNKIVIARDVVSDLLADFPEGQNLGLTVYGHRTRGDCSDIETVVAPGAGTVPAISEAVNAINPRGKTPMTDAVIAAAEALRYTEEKATVVLVSDGIETCNPDPCAAARALEQAGIDFTAHVIGFDVTDPEALAQMQCLAEETGGTFTTAANAGELTEALAVVAEPEPEPQPVAVTFRAVTEDGALIADPVIWDVTGDATPLAEEATGNPFEGEALAGLYTASAYWTAREATEETSFTVTGDAPVEVTVTFPLPAVTAELTARDSAPLGSEVEVGWTGPGADGDYIDIVAEGATYPSYLTYANTGAPGAPVTIRMPPTEGAFDLRYRHGGETIARRPITATPVPASLIAAASATAGADLEVTWEGPDYHNDYISVSGVGEDRYVNYTYTREGSPLDLLMPAEPGAYELRYVLAQGETVLASVPIMVEEVGATLTAPDQAVAGATVSIGWDGPDYNNDYIAVSGVGEDGYVNYTYTRAGNPLDLLMPPEPGDYELRYILSQDQRVLASRPITVTEVGATLTAPETAVAGSTIPVGWEGPDYQNDYIAVSEPGEDGYVNYSYTSTGNPVDLLLPTEPGEYELRYVLNQDSFVLVSRSITVTDVGAEVTAPAQAPAGATVAVGWTGPDYQNDYISVAEPGDGGYVNYTYSRTGNPAQLMLPTEPGTYEIRYVANQDSSVLASTTIEVTPLKVTLSGPATAAVGETVEVRWDGPDYHNDYIGIGRVGEDRYEAYEYTRTGNPTAVQVPAEPGSYELRYYLNQDSRIMAREPLEVSDLKVTLVSPPSGTAGGTMTVGHDGPDYHNDYIGIALPGEDRYLDYTYTREGNPLQIDLPDQPGTYELRYYMNLDSRVLGVSTVEVTQ